MKLVVGQLTNQFHSYPPPCSQHSTTGLYRKRDESTPHPDTVLLHDVFQYYPSI